MCQAARAEPEVIVFDIAETIFAGDSGKVSETAHPSFFHAAQAQTMADLDAGIDPLMLGVLEARWLGLGHPQTAGVVSYGLPGS